MHLFLFAFVVLCVLFRRQMRTLILAILILIGVASWWTGSYWSDRYNHWVDCGSPQVGVCDESDPPAFLGNPTGERERREVPRGKAI